MIKLKLTKENGNVLTFHLITNENKKLNKYNFICLTENENFKIEYNRKESKIIKFNKNTFDYIEINIIKEEIA